jgi:zinc transporter ZupT
MLLSTFLPACGFALIHVFIGRLGFFDVVPRSRWLSAAGGVAVAYVFLHILPELAGHQHTFAEGLGASPATAEALVYLTALAGLSVFYGLERRAAVYRARRAEPGGDEARAEEERIFRLHIGSFALYNLLIGYLLLHREETGPWSLAAYFVAMALHFVTTDFGLRLDHRQRYDRVVRWVLVAAVLAGWGLGAATTIPPVAIGFAFAFLAGAVVLNVLKEELPEHRRSRFWPFLLGAGGYAALLLAGW